MHDVLPYATFTVIIIGTLGSACRFKLGWLKKKFKTPEDAERYYSSQRFTDCEAQTSESHNSNQQFVDCGVQTDLPPVETDQLPKMTSLEKLSGLFSIYCERELNILVPPDFLKFAAVAMERLKSCNRSNVLYSLAKGLGTMRNDQSDSCFPVKRMPMGLIEYACNFFVSETLEQVTNYN